MEMNIIEETVINQFDTLSVYGGLNFFGIHSILSNHQFFFRVAAFIFPPLRLIDGAIMNASRDVVEWRFQF